MKSLLFSAGLCCALLCATIGRGAVSFSQQDSLPQDTVRDPTRFFELSLGHSLLFISNTRLENVRKNESIIVPTNAILFFLEFRPVKTMRIPVFVNLPTQTKQFIVDNVLVSERASPTFGTGLQFRCFSIKIGKKSAMEFEAGPLASCLLDQNNTVRFAPVLAGRFRFLKNSDFVIYLGSSYSVGIDAMGVLFGTGYIF
jgi:hypothetical protein